MPNLMTLVSSLSLTMLPPRKHGRGTRGAAPASDAARRGTRRPTRLPTRRTASAFFFFFFSRIRTDSARFAPNRPRFAPNRADSAKIGPYRVVSAGGRYGRYGRNRPKNGRNRPETAEIGLEYGCQSRNLHSSFFFCESRHSMCFLRIF